MVMAERGKTPVRVGFYDIERTIGKGNFAVVKLARHRTTKTEVAIKIIDKTQLDASNLQKVHREVKILKALDHPNIIKLIQVMESKNMIYLVSEFASNGEIYDYIIKNGNLSEPAAKAKFRQILSAVEYCHSKNIVHRDLKAENLLLDANMNMKIADWGFSNYFSPHSTLNTWCGSPFYAAPEVFAGKKYTGPEIDVWSLGVVLYVLICGSVPFAGDTLTDVRERVLSGRFRIPYFMSSDCENLLRKMLVLDPSRRYTIPKIQRHRWVRIDLDTEEPEQIPLQVPEGNSEPNEQVLRVMQELGIDIARTRESLLNDAYNNHTAIYLLIMEKMKQQKTSMRTEKQMWMKHQRRRPSSVAETALRKINTKHSKSSSPPLPKASGSGTLQDSFGRQLPSIPNEPQGSGYPSYYHSRRSESLPHDESILGTMPSVCHPFREEEIFTSPLMAGKAYRECKDTASGSTSVDEGVEVDVCDSDTGSLSSYSRQFSGNFQGTKSSSLQSEMSHFTDSPIGSVTSEFESFESQLEPDIGACLPASSVLSHATLSTHSPPLRTLTPGHHGDGSKIDERRITRSPIDFREGRRASDGLVTQGLIAFKQRLMETERSLGLSELYSVKQEHEALTSIYQSSIPDEEATKQQAQHARYCDSSWRHSYAGCEPNRPCLVPQRISLPDPVSQRSINELTGPIKPLQQQMFQHRLQQKRQTFQKQAIFPRQAFPVTKQMLRQASYKMAQQQTVLPPLPVELQTSQMLSERTFPTIEEHEIPEQDESDEQDEQYATPSPVWVGLGPSSDLFRGGLSSGMKSFNLHSSLNIPTSAEQIESLSSTQPNIHACLEASSFQNNLQSLPSTLAACQISDSSALRDDVTFTHDQPFDLDGSQWAGLEGWHGQPLQQAWSNPDSPYTHSALYENPIVEVPENMES